MIGVLNLQGGVIEHLGHLEQLGVASRRVRAPEDLEGLRGLIIPGGESTCLRRLLARSGLDAAIGRAWEHGLHVWGTCAGAILLAGEIEGESPCLGLIDIRIRRNAFGSQLDSFNAEAAVPGLSETPVPLVFIRAPRITATGPGVRILLRLDDTIAAVEGERSLVTVFHPELTPCLAFHQYFVRRCGEETAAAPAVERTPAAAIWPRTLPILPRRTLENIPGRK